MKTWKSITPIILACSLAFTACGGSGGSTPVDPSSLSGTAAAGAAIIGTVTVKGSLGNTKSATIEADGNYTVDVTGLTAPYRLRAQGTVGGKTYKLHSYAGEADLGGTVNITPFTDLIIANAAQQIAESFFDATTDAGLDPAEIDVQEDALQAKLQNVLDALGVDAAIDLLNSSFSANHSGLDAALDIISVEVDPDTNTATITNLIDNMSIIDSVVDGTDNTEVITVSDPGALTTTVSDTQAIANLFDNFAAAFVGGLPTSAAIDSFFAADFLMHETTKGQFLTELTTDPTLKDLAFAGVSVSDLDSAAGTATVKFNVVWQGTIDPETETWLVAKDATYGWQIRGDQRIVDVQELGFHCNDYDGTDGMPGGCGINVRFWDENFDNNGTSGAPIASGTVTIIDGTDGTTVKDIVYLGTPDFTAPGDVQVYNEAFGNYQGDWKAFGTGLGDINPAIFAAGDIVEYKLYTQALDLSTPSAPAVAVGTEVATYTSNVVAPPATVGLYPTATAATLTALENFSLGNNLTVAWTLAAGTISEEVLLEISDSQWNRLEVWDESFSSSATSVTIASSSLDSAAATAAGLDSQAATYDLLIRIYAIDPLTGQNHSTDYRTTIPGPGALPVGGGTGLACGYESGWDDLANGGLGAPINPNSFADYESVVTDCGTAQSFTVAEVAGKTFDSFGETTTFSDSAGAGTAADPKTGIYDDGTGFTANFVWYVEAATCVNCNHNYVVLYSDTSIDANLPVGFIRETTALTSIVGSSYSYVKYSEQSNYSDTERSTGADGEIWNSVETLL